MCQFTQARHPLYVGNMTLSPYVRGNDVVPHNVRGHLYAFAVIIQYIFTRVCREKLDCSRLVSGVVGHFPSGRLSLVLVIILHTFLLFTSDP